MYKITLQDFIYGSPDRVSLMNYESKSINNLRISVYRNHSFELVEHTIAPFLDFSDIKAQFIYSDYDDSLSFFELDLTTDMMILWLDLERYKIKNIVNFIEGRLEYLKTIYKKPIIAAFISDLQFKVVDSNIIYYSFKKYYEELGNDFFDLRLESLSGTRMSPKLILNVSKDLGLNYIPALIYPRLKAIILDLDNTLYHGVLGEDGYNNLNLTTGHLVLQRHIKKLKRQGFLLCIASKNNEDDVLEMFTKREDFPLKQEDFTKIICSWESKADSIQTIAEYLNIGTDSILFVDDNPGELINVNQQIPNVRLLLAQPEAEKTLEILENYPGLLKLHSEFEDTIRSKDVEANEKRKNLKLLMSNDDYIRSLDMELKFSINDRNQASRISELSNKTNQFIFNYKRFNIAEIESIMDQPNAVIVSVELSDRLSSSGTIGVCVVEKINDILEVQDCFVSCRALGRGIDELIVCGAMSVAKEYLSVNKIHVNFQKGARNIPAERFVNEHLNNIKEKSSKWDYQFPESLVKIKIKRS